MRPNSSRPSPAARALSALSEHAAADDADDALALVAVLVAQLRAAAACALGPGDARDEAVDPRLVDDFGQLPLVLGPAATRRLADAIVRRGATPARLPSDDVPGLARLLARGMLGHPARSAGPAAAGALTFRAVPEGTIDGARCVAGWAIVSGDTIGVYPVTGAPEGVRVGIPLPGTGWPLVCDVTVLTMDHDAAGCAAWLRAVGDDLLSVVADWVREAGSGPDVPKSLAARLPAIVSLVLDVVLAWLDEALGGALGWERFDCVLAGPHAGAPRAGRGLVGEAWVAWWEREAGPRA
jgi:hypothetical protein